MRRHPALAACLLLTACADAAPPPAAIAPIVEVARQVIGDDCARAAGEAFGLPPGQLQIGAIEAQGSRFHAIGQWPAEGPPQMRFDCLYDSEGRFETVRPL